MESSVSPPRFEEGPPREATVDGVATYTTRSSNSREQECRAAGEGQPVLKKSVEGRTGEDKEPMRHVPRAGHGRDPEGERQASCIHASRGQEPEAHRHAAKRRNQPVGQHDAHAAAMVAVIP